MADRFPLILNTSINQIQEIASGDQLDLTGNNIANAGIISATTFKGALDITSASFSGTINANGNLDVDGQTELDHVNISGITTFVGEIDANGKIVGAQLDNVIPFYYDNTGQFPSASTYHGAVAHAHNTGKLYFAHAGWKELVSKEANGTIGVGTEVYNIGTLTVSGGVSIGGTLTYEDVTNIDSVGIVTAREGVFIPHNKELKIGNTAASPDLKIYHDTSDSIIHQDGTGDLRIRSDNSIEINTNGTQNAIWCDAGAAVKLYYNNGLKLKTTNTGVEVGDSVANTGVLSVNGGTSSNPILASTSSDYVGKFSSTDAVARLIIQDDSGTNNGNGIQVQGDTLRLMTGDSPALTCDSSQNVTIAGNLDLGDSNITNVGTIACDSIKGDADDNTNITFATNDVITFKAGTTSPALTINTTQVKVENSQKFIAGTGNALEIFFDGTHSKIDHTPTSGSLFLAGDALVLSNSGMGQYYLQAAENGAVSIGYSGSTKLATSNTGVTITGTASATSFEGGSARFTDDGSTGPIVSIFTDDATPYAFNIGNSSYNTSAPFGLNFFNNNSGEGYFRHIGNAAYLDYHFSLHDNSTNKLCMKFEGSNQSVELYAEGDKKLHTNGNGIVVSGGAYFSSAAITGTPKLYLYGYAGTDGKGVTIEGNEAGLEVVSSANGNHSSSFLLRNLNDGFVLLNDNDSNQLQIRQFTAVSNDFSIHGTGNGLSTLKNCATFDENGSANLYHNDNLKLSTKSDGLDLRGQSSNIHIYMRTSDGTQRGEIYANDSNQIGFLDETGNWAARFDRNSISYLSSHWVPNANDTYDLGETGTRWRNLYVNDLQLSNESKKDKGGNDVDGTWGDWTLQEGESDIYMINNRTGKKYSMVLKEVA